MPEHLPGPWAVLTTLGTGTGAAAMVHAILGETGPIAFGVGALLSMLAAAGMQCVARHRQVLRERELDLEIRRRRELGEDAA